MKKPNTKKIIEVLNVKAGMVTYAAEAMKVSTPTLYRWINKSPELQEALNAIRNANVDMAESALIDKIKQGDTTAIIFYLKCQGKGRGYVERQQVMHLGKMDVVHYYLPEQANKQIGS